MFDGLVKADLYDEALIIVVSDHGEGFGEHGVQSHQWYAQPIDERVRTHLLIKYPGDTHTGKTMSHLVQHADIHASVAKHAGKQESSPGLDPLNTTDQIVISKLNTVIRATTPDGTIYCHRDGSEMTDGTVSSAAKMVVRDASFPSVETLNGDVPGLANSEVDAMREQ
ncbi:sulfatase-like hydrolase/transferase [Halobacteriaceae archaeon GCM10025711]